MTYEDAYKLYEQGEYKEAATLFAALTKKTPVESKVWFGLASSLQEAGELEKSLIPWAIVALLNKEDPYPHYFAAQNLYQLEKWEDAKLAVLEAKRRIWQGHALSEPISRLEALCA